MKQPLPWRGIVALPELTVDGRLLTVVGHRELPLPLTYEGDPVGVVEEIEVESGVAWARGQIDISALAKLPQHIQVAMTGTGVPAAVTVILTGPAGMEYVEGLMRLHSIGEIASVALVEQPSWDRALIRLVFWPDAPSHFDPMPGERAEPEPGLNQGDDAAGYGCWRAWLAATAPSDRSRAEALTMANYGVWSSSVPAGERNRWVRFAAELIELQKGLGFLKYQEARRDLKHLDPGGQG